MGQQRPTCLDGPGRKHDCLSSSLAGECVTMSDSQCEMLLQEYFKRLSPCWGAKWTRVCWEGL